MPREQRKLILTRFNLQKVLFSLAWETGTISNNLIIILGAAKLYAMWLGTKLRREKAFCAYSTNLYQYYKGSGIYTFIPAFFNGNRNCSHMEKVNYFTSSVFFLFVCRSWRKNERLRVIFQYKSSSISVYVKTSALDTVIYLLENLLELELQFHFINTYLLIPGKF